MVSFVLGARDTVLVLGKKRVLWIDQTAREDSVYRSGCDQTVEFTYFGFKHSSHSLSFMTRVLLFPPSRSSTSSFELRAAAAADPHSSLCPLPLSIVLSHFCRLSMLLH
ncbi:hypothetical protein VNO77_10067 [Canavalia gladiata]|uniref:Uncharacterized protein n=1 Tax=Canavalia gladiata TaxID=3824 RepID=A0AAN9MAJ0_CANGL